MAATEQMATEENSTIDLDSGSESSMAKENSTIDLDSGSESSMAATKQMATKENSTTIDLDSGSVRARREDDGSFDCHVCIQMAQDPVVTLCGHLFCWRCLQLWLNRPSAPDCCPVCRRRVTPENVVPIYGGGEADAASDRPPMPRLVVHRPRRVKKKHRSQRHAVWAES